MSPVRRALLMVTSMAVVVTLTTAGMAAADPIVIPPVSTIPPVSAIAPILPTCLPGQEATSQAGSGTPAPLGNLQGLPAELKGGGSFAGIALDGGQVEMAATVIAVGKQMGITRRGIEIGISVATEQSSLRPEALNKDWLGLFQQNPVTYTQYRRAEPGGASWMFYDQLIKQVPGYETDPRQNYEIGDVVQKTTTGERFAEYQAMATTLAEQLLDKVSLKQDDVTCAPAPAEQTTTGTAFDPGNIISDSVFYNTAAMTVDQIRVFLRSEGEGCTGSYCLKNLSLTTPDQPADRYCAAYQGGTNEDAATVISKFSTACGISPQVMLVTLQKESGLLSRADTSAASYNAAWGWHCPDSGPGGTANCDPAYAGFFNQGYGMAKQWSRYRLDPDKYNYRAGQTVNILWNVVESGCGSAPVTIQNTATASLYIYTPYQPNAAALAAYPGTGDSCSAYGNRNFFYMFRKYFGSTGGGSSTTSSAVLATGTTVKIPDNQYVSAALAGQNITAPNAAVAAGLAAGFTALGMPYVWGGGGSGAGPNNGCTRGGGDFNSCGAAIGFDCSGLTAYVLGMAGYQTPGDSGSQRSAGTSISWAEALPGDIVGFPGHVAIYLGTFGGIPYILEASWVGTPIHIVPLTRTDVDDRVHRYWTGPAVKAPGVANFGSIVQGYSPSAMIGSRTYSGGSTYSGWTGSGSSVGGNSSSMGSNNGYVSTIPRIQPRPWPTPVAQAPVTPAPVTPAPVPQEPAPPVVTPNPPATTVTQAPTVPTTATPTTPPTTPSTPPVTTTTNPTTTPSAGTTVSPTSGPSVTSSPGSTTSPSSPSPSSSTAPPASSTSASVSAAPGTAAPETAVSETAVPESPAPETAAPETPVTSTTATTTAVTPAADVPAVEPTAADAVATDDQTPETPADPNAPVTIESTPPTGSGRTASGQRAPEPDDKD